MSDLVNNLLVHEGIIFKRYPTYPELFAVSETGDVLSLRGNTPRILKQHKSKLGYMTIGTKIGGRNGKALLFRIHRMVIETWGMPPTNQQIRDSGLTKYGKVCVNHIDGNKANNIITNLEWVSHSDNSIHAINKGLCYKNPLLGDNPMEKWLFATQQSLETIVQWVDRYEPFCRINGARSISREFNIGHEAIIDSVKKYRYYFPNGHLIDK